MHFFCSFGPPEVVSGVSSSLYISTLVHFGVFYSSIPKKYSKSLRCLPGQCLAMNLITRGEQTGRQVMWKSPLTWIFHILPVQGDKFRISLVFRPHSIQHHFFKGPCWFGPPRWDPWNQLNLPGLVTTPIWNHHRKEDIVLFPMVVSDSFLD